MADAIKTLIQAFVCTRPTATPCCMVCPKSCSQSRTLWHVWITGARRCDHTTPVLQQLHWLPVDDRLTIKWHAWCTSHCQAMHPGTEVPGWRHQPCCQQWSSLTSISIWQDMRGTSDIHQLWRQKFQRRWTTCVEHFDAVFATGH